MLNVLEAPVVTEAMRAQFEAEGYFILRQVIPTETALECRGVIKNVILTPEPDDSMLAGRDPMDPMGDSPEARAARFRKLGRFCVTSPLIWSEIHANQRVLNVARAFLGDADILLKFNSVFVKPARTGSATPWHQDNGLWRDGETEPFNFWMALDPATRENGCMQFIPGSHREPIHTHVLYPGGIHGELPHAVVQENIAKRGLKQIEMAPGDAVFWHSSLFHYSPPNPSPRSRIAVAGVYTTPALAARSTHFRRFEWCMRGGAPVLSFPPEIHTVGAGVGRPLDPFPNAPEA